MYNPRLLAAMTLTAALVAILGAAQAFDETKHPNWKGQWLQLGESHDSAWDPTKPPGAGQQAPLTPEYQAIFDANVKSAADGGVGPDGDHFDCVLCVAGAVGGVVLAHVRDGTAQRQ